MSDVHKCGFCNLFARLLRRFICGKRRGSSDTCYRELGNQDELNDGQLAEEILCDDMTDQEPFTCYTYRRSGAYGFYAENCFPRQVEFLLSRSSIWEFDTHDLDRATGGRCLPVLGMHFFLCYGIIDFFGLPIEKCWKLFQLIDDNYHANPYHNSIHAADVTQAVHCFLQTSPLRKSFRHMDVMVLFLAAMTHDLDHPGVNQSFLMATNHTLAILYKDRDLGGSDVTTLPSVPLPSERLESMVDLLAAEAKGSGDVSKKVKSRSQSITSEVTSPQISTKREMKYEPVIEENVQEDKNENSKKDDVKECAQVEKVEEGEVAKQEIEDVKKDKTTYTNVVNGIWYPPPVHSESILEHHHWRMAYSCILQSGIFDHMPEKVPQIETMLKALILATDITRQDDYLTVFNELLNQDILSLDDPDHRMMVLQMALKTADISNPGRPWWISKKWSLKVCDEFFKQGDLEKEKNLKVSNLCNRATDTIPAIQIGFFQYIVLPLFTQWHRFLKSKTTRIMLNNLEANTYNWLRMQYASDLPSAWSDGFITAADMVQDTFDTATELMSCEDFGTVTGSAEMLAPLVNQRHLDLDQEVSSGEPRQRRRRSYSPAQIKLVWADLRRYSVPLPARAAARGSGGVEARPASRSGSTPQSSINHALCDIAAAVVAPASPLIACAFESLGPRFMSTLDIALVVSGARGRERAALRAASKGRARTRSAPAGSAPRLPFCRTGAAVAMAAAAAAVAAPCDKPASDSTEKNSSTDSSSDQLIDLHSPPQLNKNDIFVEAVLTSDDESEKVKIRLTSAPLEEDSSSSQTGSNRTGGSAHMQLLTSLSAATITPSGPSSDSRLDDALESDIVEEDEESVAEVTYVARSFDRRGSAPANPLSELQRIASNLSLQLGQRRKHSASSCHQWMAAEALPATGRRGSLPVEVMTGACISAL